jgi:hypothetical protein
VVTQPKGQQQHLVSKGLQKNFADDDERVAVLDAQSGETLCRRRPIKSNWRIENFVGVALESKFAKTEGRVFDQIRRITPTRITDEQKASP